MNTLTRIIVAVWLVLVAVAAAARVGSVAALQPLASAIVADGTIASPISIVTLLTFAYLAVAWRVEVGLRKREEKEVLREKPGLMGDKAALNRERRIRRKELQIQQADEKALRIESRVRRGEMRAVQAEKSAQRKETLIEQRREMLRAKREELREREALGR